MRLILIVSFLLSSSLLWSQVYPNPSFGTIEGRTIDPNNNPIPYASVGLFSMSDSLLINGSASDDHGFFQIESEPGTYFIKASFLSFEDYVSAPFEIKVDDVIKLGKIEMTANAAELQAIDIIEEKSQMEFQLDKRVYNIGKDLSNTGGNAQEILANVPSVNVDVEGNVSLRGSENVRILIDGRPSGIAASGDALRMLQGSMIDQIEVITNPSSRYDAEGEVGIINIVLKKEKKKGLNGAFEVKAGYPENFGASFSLNYRKKWMNLFASNGINYRSSPGYGYNYNRFESPDTNYIFESNRTQKRGGLSNVSRLGTDIYLNEKNIVTTAVLIKYSDANNSANIQYLDYNNGGDVFRETNRDEDENEISLDIEASMVYSKKFDDKDRSWVTSVSVNQNDDAETSSLIQSSEFSSTKTETYQRSTNTEDQRNYLFQSDYVHPFGKDMKFEGGLKASLRTISNNYSVDLKDTGEWIPLTDFTNELAYQEDIYAAYVMHAKQMDKFSYQLGVRSEYSDITTKLIKTNQTNPRSYLNFFPSAHFNYELNDTHSFQLGYSRRISRPRFRELIPFFSYTDPRNIYSGNPDLNPEYTDSYELGYLYQFGKGSLFSSVYYRHTTGSVERITVTDSTGLLRRFPINLGTQDAYGLEFNVQYDILSWWRLTASSDFYHATQQGTYQGKRYTSSAFTNRSRGSFNFKLPSQMNLQVSGVYYAPRNTTQGKTLAMATMDLGWSKELLKGNGTLAFSARDVFNSQVRRWEMDTEYLNSTSEFQWQSRQFMLTFTYRLNQKKAMQRSRGGEDEGSDF